MRPRIALATMKISLNGESIEIVEAKTIADLIDRYQLPPQSILVEHNGLAIHRHEWSERPLAQGDRIEFIASSPVARHSFEGSQICAALFTTTRIPSVWMTVTGVCGATNSPCVTTSTT